MWSPQGAPSPLEEMLHVEDGIISLMACSVSNHLAVMSSDQLVVRGGVPR